MNETIAKRIALTVRQSSPDTIAQFCEELENLSTATDLEGIKSAIRHIQHADTRASFHDLVTMTKAHELHIDAQSLSLAIRSASAAWSSNEQDSHIDLVWSGPSKSMSTLRRTDQVLSDIIGEAQRTILVVSFAVFKVPHIMGALGNALKRGVLVKLIIETEKDSGGRLKSDGLTEIRNAGIGAAELYVWPESVRPKTANGYTGVLHAKCAVVDSKVAFISSANLTDAALHLNMELGLIVRGSTTPSAIEHHFTSLISAGVISRISS